MEERIGHVVLNYDYYLGEDEYSDGEVEDKILSIVRENNEYERIIDQEDSFPIFYHLSRTREFITEVMEICSTDKVLEIGAGCGAISGALAKKAKCVVGIDLSKKRSMINAYKNKDCDNLCIYVGNYEDITLAEKFDVITLIGVWEYSKFYIHSEKPFHDMLKSVMNKLNDGGRVYIAIENRLGIKYFAGCREDHTSGKFDGIEGYASLSKVETFSYYKLLEIFKECGISNYEFFYPYPDYKFPLQIFSDKYLPNEETDFLLASDYGKCRKQYFDESLFYRSLVMNKEYRIFANSFLLCLRK